MPDKDNRKAPKDSNFLEHSQYPPIRTPKKPENSVIHPMDIKKKPPQNKEKEEK